MCCIENHASPAFSEWSETKLRGMEKRRGRGLNNAAEVGRRQNSWFKVVRHLNPLL